MATNGLADAEPVCWFCLAGIARQLIIHRRLPIPAAGVADSAHL
jgi:hypothetical protein